MLEPTLKDYGNRSRRNSGSGYSSSGPNRPPALGGRSPQSSFDSNGDVGQISLNFMRINGNIASNVLKGTGPTTTASASAAAAAATTSKSNQHSTSHFPVGLNVSLHSNNGGGTTTTTTTVTNPIHSHSLHSHSPHSHSNSTTTASNIDGRNGISRVGSTPITIEQTSPASAFTKRKESWQFRKTSDPVKISIEGM
uniref:Uncharacterized protein n=1 Tax=Panagrolaimus sp. PS1159 TaxID=55785 RepID=A0AC35GHQ9_9BILA